MLSIDTFKVKPGHRVDLSSIPSRQDGDLDEADAKRENVAISEQLVNFQRMMYAEHKHKMLIVFQAMDAGGKDSTIRRVFGPINPQGCRVASFKKPSREELEHDYLWRIHEQAPRTGMIKVFNRSHYESILIERVRNLVPKSVWKRRYHHINEFERLLAEEGTVILKFYLHISKDHQKRQFEDRLNDPNKNWKFNAADLEERALWDDYRDAFEDALSRCSTDHAPWYIVPAERKWFRDLVVGTAIRDAFDSLDMAYPTVDWKPEDFTIE